MIPWSEKIYDMTEEEIQEYKDAYKEAYHSGDEKRDREVIDVFYMEYQYYQVRKNWDWVLEQYRIGGDKMAIRREILMQRLRGSSNGSIDPEDIEYLISNMKKSDRDLLICKKWLFKLYPHGQGSIGGFLKDLDENIPYIVGIDPAGGGGGDNFAITILNPINLLIAAEFKNPYLSGPNAVRMLCSLVHDYIPKACLVIERNSMGITILQMLLETDIRDNIYWSEKKTDPDAMIDDNPNEYQLKEMNDQYQKYGTFLSQKVRRVMFELLFQHVDQCKQLLCTEYLVDDLCKLVTINGKPQADKGQHDDCLMSYLHCLYVYYYGDNLARFGIFPQQHPVWGDMMNEVEQGDDSPELINRIMGETHETWDEYVMRDAAREELITKDLCDRFSFINCSSVTMHQQDDVRNIPVSFFDSINGV